MVASIVLNPTHAKVGTSVLITGAGFNAGDTVSITYGGSPITATEAPIVVAGDGTLPTCHIVIPASVEGIHSVVVTDQTLNTANADFTVDPFISLTPSTQRIGGTIEVIGSGFAGASLITLLVGGIDKTPVTHITDANGNFDFSGIVVPTLASGAETVSATDGATNNATATLTVSAPTLVRSPTHGPVGTVVTLTGANYVPLATITITNIDSSTTTTTADASGNIPAGVQITIPAKAQGSHNITASDGTNTGTVAFTVDSAVSISPSTGRIGSTPTLSATGLAANSAITVDFAGTDVTPGGSPTTDANGSYSGSITVPTKTSGAKTVTITDAALNAPTTSFTVLAPTLVLTPNHGPVGTVVTITGDNYIPSQTLTVTNTDGATSTVTANASGSIPASSTITIESTEIGAQSVTCSDGTNTATATFTIEPKITVDPTYGPAGAEVVVTGSGFAAGVGITFTLNGTPITPTSPVTSDADGAFTGTLDLPANLANGNNPIVATDASANSATVNYDVSNTVPFTLVPEKTNSYEYIEDMHLDITDASMVDQLVIDCRVNRKELLINLYVDGPNGVTFSTFGIIHESDNNIPPSDPVGIKKWTALDANVAVATTANASKTYTDIMYSYILLQAKYTATGATTAKFSARRPSEK